MGVKSKYQPTPTELSLFSNTINTRQLNTIDETSQCNIQRVSFKGIKTLKSVEDNFRKIRIVVAALLVKIHVTYNECNADRLNRIKSMVYSSKLLEITQQKGIQKQQLLKSFAQSITSLQISSEAQTKIVRLFNCKPFFDQIIVSSIHQQNPLLFKNDCQLVAWLNRQFSIKVLMNEQSLLQESENQLCLIGLGEEFHPSKDCRSSQCNFKGFKDYLRFSSEGFEEDSDISQLYDRRSNQRLFDSTLSPSLKHSKYLKGSNNLFMSINSICPSGDETLKNTSKQLASTQKCTISLFDSITFQKNKAPSQVSSPQIKIIKVRKSKNKQEASNLLNFLCCNFRQ